MNRTALISLKEKVEAGAEFDWGFCENPARLAFPVMWGVAMRAYEGSLDAAKALHESVLPGRGTAINTERGYVAIYGKGIAGKCDAACFDNPARAWLLAILSALIAMETDREEEREAEEGY